jgi:hypothetical protein
MERGPSGVTQCIILNAWCSQHCCSALIPDPYKSQSPLVLSIQSVLGIRGVGYLSAACHAHRFGWPQCHKCYYTR